MNFFGPFGIEIRRFGSKWWKASGNRGHN